MSKSLKNFFALFLFSLPTFIGKIIISFIIQIVFSQDFTLLMVMELIVLHLLSLILSFFSLEESFLLMSIFFIIGLTTPPFVGSVFLLRLFLKRLIINGLLMVFRSKHVFTILSNLTIALPLHRFGLTLTQPIRFVK